VLGFVSDSRKKLAGRRLAATLALGGGFLALVGVLGALLIVERQYGLDTIVSANLGADIFGKGAGLVVQKASDLLSWMRTNVLS
jgi:hypothetical protein